MTAPGVHGPPDPTATTAIAPGPELAPAPDLTSGPDLERLLAAVDSMASSRPVAARIVAATDEDAVGAAQLARLLAADVTLASRVMKLANSAVFGMRGRVETLQFAVTVVGFTTVRTMATVALTTSDDGSRVPEGFWTTTTRLALAAATVGPVLGHRAQDSLCIGLLAELGSALLHHADPEGHRATVAGTGPARQRRAAERRRYGRSSLDLSAVALDRWHFPPSIVRPMQDVDAPLSLDGAVLRVAYEMVAALADDDGSGDGSGTVPAVDLSAMPRLSCGRLDERTVRAALLVVREEAAELQRTLLGG